MHKLPSEKYESFKGVCLTYEMSLKKGGGEGGRVKGGII